MATYNGHKNWNHWNVSLWINNNPELYELARRCIRYSTHKYTAVEVFLAGLEERGITHTPDGAPYSKSAVRAAMVGM